MDLIDKYAKTQSPRTFVLMAVAESAATGFLLSMALAEFLRGHSWVLFLVLALSNGAGALQAALVSLRNCQPAPKGQ
jgi:hypothetical protein